MYNFGEVEAPVESKNLRPGKYVVTGIDCTLVEEQGKTPYLGVNFYAGADKTFERFFISPKALSRLQYLHESLFGKKLTKSFNSAKEIGAYFEKVFKGYTENNSIPRVGILVGGEQAINKNGDLVVYSRLDYSGFILSAEGLQEGAFEEGGTEYNRYLKKLDKADVPTSKGTITNEPIGGGRLPSVDDAPKTEEKDDELPF